MEKSTDIAQAYVHLALAIDQHMPGYVDAYYGPSEWKQQAEEAGPLPLVDLAMQAADLTAAIAGVADMEPQRQDFLRKELRAMQTTLRILQHESLSLVEEVEALYDISPTWVDEATFEEANDLLRDLLPPGESLVERVQQWRKSLEIPVKQAEPLLQEILSELRRRTLERFSLPPGESFELCFVSDQPWSGYNWYLGDSQSRIEINTDLPLRIMDLADLLAHEGYPGHHTDNCIKEAHLVGELGYAEFSVALLNTPSAVLAEGVAMQALATVMSEEEQIAWHDEVLFPLAGFDHLDARREYAVKAARRKLDALAGNAAFLLHDRGASEEEVVDYIHRYSMDTKQEARHLVRFLKQDLWRSYIFNYYYGERMLETLFVTRGDRLGWFARLLSEPVTPEQVREWIASGE